jgi:Xaa-Pro aminopeptidase
MKAGMRCKEIDSLARDRIAAAGYADYFGHGLGHGVGLDIHEKPSLSQLVEKEVVPDGAITTVEPGVYIPGWGGVRIEDLVLVSESGASPLSRCAKIPAIPIQ